MISQVIAVLATAGYSFFATLIILKILDVIPGLGLWASEADEDAGLDLLQHGERAFVRDGAD
jgi:Amt family ammonium transporter